ncbi:hypothetical protein Hdeb2414_s0006g00198571 [Helianthus debilis subsp. tardiflorus]
MIGMHVYKKIRVLQVFLNYILSCLSTFEWLKICVPLFLSFAYFSQNNSIIFSIYSIYKQMPRFKVELGVLHLTRVHYIF